MTPARTTDEPAAATQEKIGMMMNFDRNRLRPCLATALLMVCFFATPASAHPGHGESGWMHHTPSPEIIALAAAAAAFVIGAPLVRTFRRRADQRAEVTTRS